LAGLATKPIAEMLGHKDMKTILPILLDRMKEHLAEIEQKSIELSEKTLTEDKQRVALTILDILGYNLNVLNRAFKGIE
jgi:hypothetical protein